MSNTSKFTQSYDEREDRILLLTEDVSGESARLWLTQRLGNRLVGALVAALEASDSDVDDQYLTTVQSWEQAAALAQLAPVAPVAPTGAVKDYLIQTIHINSQAQGHRLSFVGANGETVDLALLTVELRQWLTILHGHYVKADWPLHIWPAWVHAPISILSPTVIN